jgi:uncharacterized protein (DUF1501 family)
MDSGISRRTLLRGATAAGGLGLVASTLGQSRLAFGAVTAATDTLVVLYLRGGMDGLSVVAPVGDPAYAQARPTLAVPASAVKRVDATFGLHPALAPLFPLWDAGRIAAVHAVGQPAPTRSHAEAMLALDRAAPGSSLRSGWIDRAVGSITAAGTFSTAQLGDPSLPAALLGEHVAFATGTLDQVEVQVSDSIVPLTGWRDALGLLDRAAPGQPVGPTAAALAAVGRVMGLPVAVTDAGYPATALGTALHDVARLVKADVGLRIATVGSDDWDMHANLGASDSGWLVDRLSELSGALSAFARDLGPDLDRVTLVTLSEFGRRVAENGSGGTDHGHANLVLVAGGAVNGGKVHGRWPTLSPDRLDDGDLAATTDYRQILAEILTTRCGISSVRDVFPGFTPAPLGLVAPRAAG